MPAQHHKTASDDKVSFGQKLAYGAGGYADNLMQNSVNQMAKPVFNMTLGVDPGLLTTALALPRLWDAIIDPFIGTASDNARTRWGRRKPFVVVGATLCGLLFALLWMVPHGWPKAGYLAHFFIVVMLFYTAYAVFTVPYGAVGIEMSPDYHERTRVVAFRTFFSGIAGISTSWMLWLSQRSVFTDALHGMHWVGLGVGLTMIVLGVMPALFVKERGQTKARKQRKVPLLPSLKESITIKSFRLILLIIVLMSIGLFMVNGLGYYINIYYVFGGDMRAASAIQGVTGTVYQVSGMLALPLITMASSRFGKRRTLFVCLFLPLVGTIAKWFCYTPSYPYLQVVPPLLMSPGLACLWTLLGSMLADVTDVDELKHGVRREGTLNAIYMWASKLGTSAAVLMSGYVISFSGFKAEFGGAQTPESMLVMRALVAFLPALSIAAAIIIVKRFPIGEAEAYATRKELEHRRAMAPRSAQ
ncbi:MFS transporter [Termitidicoccus mucosus]|uniref:Sugar transporter n=1 Tax=Termitidicoccus mucosus TaxID=1184151 RepID=A0A178IN06_9BACT|nr:hypothetical protein AW736_04135 [Opitutaceae bacterium TSB47]